jgi:hypothetical protein
LVRFRGKVGRVYKQSTSHEVMKASKSHHHHHSFSSSTFLNANLPFFYSASRLLHSHPYIFTHFFTFPTKPTNQPTHHRKNAVHHHPSLHRLRQRPRHRVSPSQLPDIHRRPRRLQGHAHHRLWRRKAPVRRQGRYVCEPGCRAAEELRSAV